MRRQCVFVGPQPRDSRPDRVSSDTDVDQRLRYMERLLRHYAGDISLETDDLRAAVETVSKEASPRAEGVERRRSTDSDDLEAEAESFTVQPLENNATRMCTTRLTVRRLILSVRLLGRILPLELLHAHQGVDRPVRRDPEPERMDCQILSQHD